MSNALVSHNAISIPRKKYPNVNATQLQRLFKAEGLDTLQGDKLSRVLVKILSQQATDEQLNYDYIERAVPAGHQASVSTDAAQTGITTVVDLTNLTVTFHALKNRRYLIIAQCEVSSTAADGVYILTLTDEANTVLQRDTKPILSTNSQSAGLTYQEIGQGIEVTRKLRLAKAGGTGSVALQADPTFPAILLVQDIGPA